MQSEKMKKLAKAALLAFEYIGDRSAGSSEAWDALADALGRDVNDASCHEMVAEDLVNIANGRLE
jgi:hypothetical protein